MRNSGASAVVEGVGEFCAEYMTNGVIMNLGGFSKGMGNGMSGGFIYQFDPNKACGGLVSHDSIDFSYLGNESSVNETPVSYTHPPSPRDRSLSRMPSSA